MISLVKFVGYLSYARKQHTSKNFRQWMMLFQPLNHQRVAFTEFSANADNRVLNVYSDITHLFFKSVNNSLNTFLSVFWLFWHCTCEFFINGVYCVPDFFFDVTHIFSQSIHERFNTLRVTWLCSRALQLTGFCLIHELSARQQFQLTDFQFYFEVLYLCSFTFDFTQCFIEFFL